MDFNEAVQNFEQFKDSEDYTNYVNGLVNDDRVTAYLETENGKKLMQPKLDSYFSKGLETWKSNNLQKLIDDKVSELYPEQTAEQKELATIKAQLAEMQAAATREKLKNSALTYATEKKLPTDIVDYFIGKDEAETTANLKKLESVFSAAIKAAAKDGLKQNSYTPTSDNDDEEIDGIEATFRKLNPNLKI